MAGTMSSPGSRSYLAEIRIDTTFLLRQVPTLVQIRRKHRTWDHFGEKLIRDLQKQAPAKASEWPRAKQLIHSVLATREAEHDAIRKRLGDLPTASTAKVISTLGLWLAGELGMSTSMTNPMVAVMLFAVAEAGGDWAILIDC